MFFPSIFFFSNKRKKKKKHREEKKCRKGKAFSFKLPFCLCTFGSYFCPPTSALLFQMFFFGIFFFSSIRKEKKRRKKNHKVGKKCRERRALSFKLPICPFTQAPASAFPLLPSHFYLFVSNVFFLASSFSQAKEKKKKTKEKKCRKGKELTFLLLLLHLG
jgi:preprotein translocase subunit YajC